MSASETVLEPRRVIFTCKGDILGHWDLEWTYLWEQLREPPALTAKGISFTLKVLSHVHNINQSYFSRFIFKFN